jgi:chromosome segregation ATPase
MEDSKNGLERDLRGKEETLEGLVKDELRNRKVTEGVEGELQELRNGRDAAEDELSRLRGVDSRVEVMRERIGGLESARENDLGEIERMRRDGENFKTKERQLKGEVEKLGGCLAEKEAELVRHEDRIKELKMFEFEAEESKNKINLLLKEESVLKSQISRLHSRNEDQTKDFVDIETQQSSAAQKLNEMDRTLAEKIRLIRNIEQEADSLRKENSTYRMKLKDNQGSQNSTNERLHLSELKVEEMKDVLLREEDKYKKLEQQLLKAQSACKNIETERIVTVESVDKLKLLIVQLEKNKEELLFRLQSENKQSETFSGDKKRLLDDLKNIKERLLSVEQELIETREGLKMMSVERDSMQSKLDDREEELAGLKDRYDEAYQLYSESKLKLTQVEGNSQHMIYR